MLWRTNGRSSVFQGCSCTPHSPRFLKLSQLTLSRTRRVFYSAMGTTRGLSAARQLLTNHASSGGGPYTVRSKRCEAQRARGPYNSRYHMCVRDSYLHWAVFTAYKEALTAAAATAAAALFCLLFPDSLLIVLSYEDRVKSLLPLVRSSSASREIRAAQVGEGGGVEKTKAPFTLN